MIKKNEDIARESQQAFEKFKTYFQRNINTYNEMTEFVLGKQWVEDEEDMFRTNKKVPLTFNKLATLCNSVIGEQQQNTPQLQVIPMDNCDEETAYLRELIVKHIALGHDAKTVYQMAASQAIIGGYGAFIIDTDYASKNAFDVDICYRYVKDPTRCYWDVGAEHINKIDGACAGYLVRMSKSMFAQTYGKKTLEKVTSTRKVAATEEEIEIATNPATKDDVFSWADGDGVTINHYYKRIKKNQTLYKLSNAEVVTQEQLDEIIEQSKMMSAGMPFSENIYMPENAMHEMGESEEIEYNEEFEEENEQEAEKPAKKAKKEQNQSILESDIIPLFYNGEMVRIEDTRIAETYKVMHYVIAGEYILEESEFPSCYLPVVFMDQHSYFDKTGKQITRPFAIDAKDAQRFLNYLGTQAAYTLKIARYDQFMGSKKNVTSNDTQAIWKDPSVVQGLLIYDESPTGERPQQLHPPEISNSLLTQYQRTMDDLYTSTGLYPSRLGQQGNEVSGAAIDARTRQGSYSTYNVFTSINRAIAAGGEVVNDMIPKVYDTERVITLMHPEEGEKSIVLNRKIDEYGAKIENDMRKGSYQVKLMPGPSYEGQKAEALQSLNMALQANPEIFQMIADLYAENLPLPNTIELKNRLKTLVPQAVIEAGKTGKPAQQPAQDPQAIMMQQQAQMAQMEMQLRQRELDLKEQEIILKAQAEQAKLEQELEKIRTERLQTAGALEEKKLGYMAETERTKSDAEIAHANNLVKILTHKI